MRIASEIAYLDASALVKLVVPEAETPALGGALKPWPLRASSAVARVEVIRTAARRSPASLPTARRLLERLTLVSVDESVLAEAAALEHVELRAIDAIHLASARSLGDDLGAFICYDRRLSDAAAAAGLPVLAPA